MKKAANRLTSTGFLEGIVTPNEQLYNLRSEEPTKEFIGIILDYDEEGSYISKASDESPRESQNLEKMYLSGIFGGIPVYD